MFERAESACAKLRERTDFVPEIAIVLGSGLGDAVDLDEEFSSGYDELGLPGSTVHGH